MEMNTRLQVEHPVTEEITGVDLVEWQLRVASGEPLPLQQDELAINGWAMEARLYAEDPAKGFLPSTGRLEMLRLPRDARLETGVDEESEVSPFYDPMIAKIIVHKHDRPSAIEAMNEACRAVAAWPVKHNAWFLARLMELPDFVSASMTTGSINTHLDRLSAEPQPSDNLLAAAASDAFFADVSWGETDSAKGLIGFRLNAAARREAALSVNGERRVVQVDFAQSEEFFDADFTWWNSDKRVFVEDGAAYAIAPFRSDGAGHHHAHDGDILSPMPGKVIAVEVAQGDVVTKGQKLLTLEAMKMEHTLTAPFDGVVAELSATPGAQVQVEALLARIEASGG